MTAQYGWHYYFPSRYWCSWCIAFLSIANSQNSWKKRIVLTYLLLPLCYPWLS